jgi:hypothetical protein
MTDELSQEALPKNKGGRPKVDSITLTKAARARSSGCSIPRQRSSVQ